MFIPPPGCRGFTRPPKKESAPKKYRPVAKPIARPPSINHRGQERVPVGIEMKDAVPAAVIGVVIGYMIHLHWPEIEWIVRVLVG